jgi:membrane carboxypeptidase/penicillin-binding protein
MKPKLKPPETMLLKLRCEDSLSNFGSNINLRRYTEGVVTPSTLLQDEEHDFEVPGEAKTYVPRNYTRKFKGTVSLRDCLVESLNVPTVKVAEMVGVDKIIRMAHQLGRAVQVEPMKPMLKALGTERLKLKCDVLV